MNKTIVSLAVIPSRILNLDNVLSDLRLQDYPIDKIYVNVCDEYRRFNHVITINEMYQIRDACAKYGANIRIVDDLGPITKFYYTCRKFLLEPETNIVVCDDDVTFHSHWLRGLVDASNKNPNASIGYRGGIVTDDFTKPYTKATPVNFGRCSYLTAVYGCLHKAGNFIDFFESDEWLDDIYRFNDDVTISAFLARKGIPKVIIPPSDIIKTDNKYSLVDALHLNENQGHIHENRIMGRHNKSFRSELEQIKSLMT